MCNQKSACVTAVLLYPLAVASIICNVLLFFPGWSYNYLLEGNITKEVKMLGGLVGGLMVLLPAAFVHRFEKCLCLGRICGVCNSILLEALGVAGAIYNFGVALSGLIHGPFCWTYIGGWNTHLDGRDPSYLFDRSSWSRCTEPEGVVQFNVILFSVLLGISGLKIIFCFSMMICGCLCLLPTALAASSK